MNDEPIPWMTDALCSQTAPEIFFLEVGESSAPARRVCGRCEVTAECLAYAQANNINEGIFGGMSPVQRARMRRGRREDVA